MIDASANYDDWAYLRPTGGASQPFRLSDFADTISIGYYDDAKLPIQISYPRGGWTFVKGGSSRALVMSFDLDPGTYTVQTNYIRPTPYNGYEYDSVYEGVIPNLERRHKEMPVVMRMLSPSFLPSIV